MSMFWRSASFPLACSISTRLLSAVCSCSLRTVLRWVVRCCRRLMVATSASAWAMRVEAGSKGPGVAQTHGQGLDRAEAAAVGCRDEAWPAVDLAGQVGDDHLCAGAEALQAGAFVVLELEELQQAYLFVGGGHDAEFAVAVREQHPGRTGAEHAHAAVGEQAQEVDQVEVGDQVVRQLDEGLGQELLIHRDTLA
jgi:hypothetical protein